MAVESAVDEKDISGAVRWHQEQLAQKAVDALKRNHFEVAYVPDRKAAFDKVLEYIPPGATIGVADSVTLHQVGLIEWLSEQKDHVVFNSFARVVTGQERYGDDFKMERFLIQQKALTANVFLTGTNAITLDGKLVNIDGFGNRVAGMIFGPNRTIFVSGINKIVRDQEEAVRRVHEWCAPVCTRRHLEKHGAIALTNQPCATTGICSYCRSEYKGCRVTVTIDG